MKRTPHDAQNSASQAIASAKAAVSTGVESLADRGARARDAATDASNQISETGAAVARSASDAVDDFKQRLSTATDNASGAIRAGVSAATSYVQDTAGSAAEFSANAARQMRDGAVNSAQGASDFVSDVIRQNPILVGGIGLAIGALIASALPRTDAELGLLGEASANLQKRANDMASRGFEVAKDLASNCARHELTGGATDMLAQSTARAVFLGATGARRRKKAAPESRGGHRDGVQARFLEVWRMNLIA
jgi:ElaB/YqjD/DUF883 family membrane-anchored ribosome-binding protein